MDAEGTDVRPSFAGNPENGKIALLIKLEQFGLVNGTNAELALYGRDERGSLEESAREGFKGARHGSRIWQCIVKAEDGNILLSCV